MRTRFFPLLVAGAGPAADCGWDTSSKLPLLLWAAEFRRMALQCLLCRGTAWTCGCCAWGTLRAAPADDSSKYSTKLLFWCSSLHDIFFELLIEDALAFESRLGCCRLLPGLPGDNDAEAPAALSSWSWWLAKVDAE